MHPSRSIHVDSQCDRHGVSCGRGYGRTSIAVFNQEPQALRGHAGPGGRASLAVWGERAKCGWSAIFPIVDEEVAGDVCPLFFRLGTQDTLARLCADAKFENVRHRRITTTLTFSDANDACDAAFVGGPVALAWSRFDDEVRARVRARYLDAIKPWRHGQGYRIPGEFVIAAAVAPGIAAAVVPGRRGVAG